MTSLAAWRDMWNELGAPAADEDLFHRLMACWSETHRHYHSPQHLDECLCRLRETRHLAQRPAEVELALWFHDAVYDPKRHDNEARCADWAHESVDYAGLPAEMAERVHALIMLTCHDAQPLEADGQLLVDIDLSILGADPERFEQSNRQIRREYAHVPEDRYREGRAAILRGFLARPRLYSTEYFHALLEERARVNLQQALDQLRQE
jgi:predicted metal-dependent HD superfamily phosphohydrolase